jgi:trimeric autotransporter adhesin
MSVTINAKGTSTTSFKVGKDGTIITQGGVISPPAATDLKIDLDVDQYMVVNAGLSGPALITASNNQDLHINPATGGGQYLILNSTRWPATDGTNGQVLRTNGAGVLSWQTVSGTGSVTSTSVVSANGFAGTVATATTTPAITLSTTVSGIIKGNGTSLSAAEAIDFPTLNQNTTGNAATATVLASGRTFSLSTDATGTSGSFDGSTNITIPVTLATVNSSPQTDTFRKVTVNGKGLTTATSAVSASDITTALTYTPVNKAGDTMTGSLVLNADPSTSLGAATKQYVDTEIAAVASGVNVHGSCETSTTAALAACTYNNGTGGVGATLTANANGVLGTIGGYSGLAVSSRLLVKDQADQKQNGIYTVVSLGADDPGGSAWQLMRATDFDGSPTSEVEAGDLTYVQEGTLTKTQWVQITVGTGHNVSPSYDYVVIGTDNIVFSQFAGPGSYTAGTGINISTNVISNIGVTSAIAGSNISVSSATGAVTFAVTGTVPSATTATNNVLKAGDTMTGDLQIDRSVNTLAGLGVTNSSSGSNASADIFLLNDTGTKGIGLEVTSSGYSGGFANQGWLYTQGSIPLIMSTGNSAQVTIDTSGNVGIGMTPTYPLDVNGVIRNAALGVPTFSLGTLNISTWNVGMLSQNTTPFDSSGKVTVGAVFAPRGTVNTPASFGNILGSYSYGTVDSTVAGSTGALYGSYGNAGRSNAADASTGWNAIYGAFGGASHSNTLPATASTAIIAGVYGNATLGGGTVTNTLSSFYGTTSLNTGASVLNISVPSVSFYDGSVSLGSTSSGTTSITNLYGLRLRTPTINSNVTITNRYGVSSEDASAINYFAGKLQLSGAIGLAGANYGTTGQVLTSQGSSAAPAWTTLSSGVPTIAIVSGTSQTAVANYQYVLTNTGAATTVTLPASPADGDIIWITNVTSRTDHVIARNGQILQGLSEDMTINMANVNIQLRFINTTIGWRIL